jgi:hypothetical protein
MVSTSMGLKMESTSTSAIDITSERFEGIRRNAAAEKNEHAQPFEVIELDDSGPFITRGTIIRICDSSFWRRRQLIPSGATHDRPDDWKANTVPTEGSKCLIEN